MEDSEDLGAIFAKMILGDELDEVDLFVKNIPYAADSTSLTRFLEGVAGSGRVVSCQIVPGKGRATVRVDSHGTAKALLDRQLCFGGRPLHITTKVKRKARHPNAQTRGASLYCGNLGSDDRTVEYLWCSQSQGETKAEFFFSDQVKVEILVGDGKYKLEILSNSIASLESSRFFEDLSSSSQQGLVFQLYYPPRLFKRRLDNVSIVNLHPEDLWARATDLFTGFALGQSIVYCLLLPGSSESDLRNILKHFGDYNLGDYPPRFKQTVLRRGRPFAIQQLAVPVIGSTGGFKLPLDVEFKVNYLIQSGYISPAGLTHDFFRLLADNPREWCLSALARLETWQTTTCLNPSSQIRNYRKSCDWRRGRYLGPIEPEEGQLYVKRVHVTPLKVYFVGPELEETNRVTRHFAHKIDNFLRVTFLDEDFDSISSAALTSGRGLTPLTEVYARLLLTLNDGVHLCGKNFQFLAFSASQLRENSLWMFADDDEVTADGIRRWMGDFLSIKNVAKCAARMGQSFSTSTGTMNVPFDEVRQIDDVEKVTYDGRKYCFSDGIGSISKEFAIQVAKKCRSSSVPSAFQIRYGGYKGVVAVDPDSNYKLLLRPSMSKFPSQQTSLDVLERTRHIPCYLNREIINLMSTLEVPDEVFERMQDDQVELLNRMLLDPATTSDILKVLYAGDCHKLLGSMLRAGFSPASEPYMRSLLLAFRSSQLLSLEKKSRIFVPKGRLLMGCLDERRILDYGQCFVQLSPQPDVEIEQEIHYDRGVTGRDQAFVVTGTVVVAKNPCLHPGDILVLEAIDVPGLHHMVDCVVFPQKGRRPHPNECSGSDLDGDQYFVSWDQSLIPPSRHEPMDYEASTAVELDHPVQLEEIQKFFVDNMTSDSLGMIAHAHLALSDSSPLQAKDPKCLELAKLFSIAVDFPKTGVPARMRPDLRPGYYPDFMEKRDKVTYKSPRVIGKLYRSIRKYHDEDNPLNIAPPPLEQQYDRDLLVEGFESYVADAQYYKDCYDSKLTSILNHYKVSEAEIMSGSVRSLWRYTKKRQGEAMSRVLLAAKALVKEARGWFDEGGVAGREADAMAAAWYHVTYDPRARRGIDQKDELLSFPWVVADRLVEIKWKNARNRRMGLKT